MPYQKTAFVESLAPDTLVESIFLVTQRQPGTTRKGDPFLKLTLSDRTGQLEARVWSGAPALEVAFREGDFLWVQARAELWQGRVQLNIADVERIDPDTVQLDDYQPATRFDRAGLLRQLRALIDQRVRSPWIRRFLDALLDHPPVTARLAQAPAAVRNHHATLGGLIEHIVSMTQLALALGDHYARTFPGMVQTDLLVAGVVLHDIGKIEELDWSVGFRYTDQGALVGHIVTGVLMIERVIADIPDFPPQLALLLKHLVVAHHGHLEFGSPRRPQLIEAVLLHHIDMIDARVYAFNDLLTAQRAAAGDDLDPDQTAWSHRSSIFDTRMMLPPPNGYAWAAPPEHSLEDLAGPGLIREADPTAPDDPVTTPHRPTPQPQPLHTPPPPPTPAAPTAAHLFTLPPPPDSLRSAPTTPSPQLTLLAANRSSDDAPS